MSRTYKKAARNEKRVRREARRGKETRDHDIKYWKEVVHNENKK